jgi:hypothetical protein
MRHLLLAALMLFPALAPAQNYAPATIPVVQFFDDSGDPCAGCKLYSFITGTSTPQSTYSDTAGTANANPLILDASGRGTVYLISTAQYRLRLDDAANVNVWGPQDNVSTWVNVTGSVVSTTGIQALTNKTFDNTNTFTIADASLTLEDNSDATKDLVFQLSNISTATTRTLTIPNSSGAPVISSLTSNNVDAANSVWMASNSVVLEGLTADGSEGTITPQDFAADRAITLLDAAGAINVGVNTDIVLCGDLPNNTTNYTSPVSGFPSGEMYVNSVSNLSFALAGSGCAAEDETTEATADDVLFANNAVKILGMYCAVSGSGSNGVVLNLRSAAASLTPDITVTIPTGSTTGATSAITTTDIAAGATFALRSISTEDLSSQDVWCMVKALIVP